MNETSPPRQGSGHGAAKILVVDDNALNRRKMRLAVRNLGHEAEVAENGAEAIARMLETDFDAVLLDIVMPLIDGFEVLRSMRRNEKLRDIPVIVISALDDETESVVKAIKLGAEDFLPKSFDPVILNARLEASLARKRFRDQEREYFGRIERLTEAAEVLETGGFKPERLELDDIAAHDDPIGKLAAVFRGMATEIYERELKLRRAIHVLQGSFLVIAVGLVWGLIPALSRMASAENSTPLGLAVWVNAIAGVVCLGAAAYRRQLPRLTGREFLFYLSWAAIAGILQRITTFVVTEHVEAAMLSLIVTLQGFMVFAFAAVAKMEKATPRRLLGLIVGLAGVSLVLLTRFRDPGGGQNAWMLVALAIPLLFAVEALVLAGRRPEHISPTASVGIMMMLSALMLAPIALATGEFMVPDSEVGRLELLVVAIGLVSALSLVLAFHLVATAGPVFYSQSAYTMTIAGVVWGVLLLDEALSVLAWAGFAIILVGMYLVEPKSREDDFVIRRSFRDR